MDNLTQLVDELPNNPLTEILKDFRKYRPIHHNEWLNYVEGKSRHVGVRNYAL